MRSSVLPAHSLSVTMRLTPRFNCSTGVIFCWKASSTWRLRTFEGSSEGH